MTNAGQTRQNNATNNMYSLCFCSIINYLAKTREKPNSKIYKYSTQGHKYLSENFRTNKKSWVKIEKISL